MNIVVGTAAASDIRAARKYYEEQRAGLDREFRTDLDRLFARLAVFPKSGTPVAGYEKTRRTLLRRFPFAVFYTERGSLLIVLRVIHRARSPSRLARLKGT